MERLGQLHSKSLLCFLILCSCTAQPKLQFANAAEKNIEAERGIHYVDNKIFTGVYYALDGKDSLWTKTYIAGREHGCWKKWHPNKQLASCRYYLDGHKEGLYQTWWPNGKKQFTYSFKKDVYEGLQLEWNSDGLLIRQMNFKDGYEYGAQKTWYYNGKIKANYLVKNNRRYGLLGTKNCINVTDSIF